MEFPDSIQELGHSAQTFVMMHGAQLEEKVRDRVIGALGAPSPVDRIVKTGEALYAARSGLNAEGKSLVAQLISFATLNGWHGLANDNRGPKIVMAMRRDLGEAAPGGTSWPAPEDDPEPLAEFAAATIAPEFPLPPA